MANFPLVLNPLKDSPSVSSVYEQLLTLHHTLLLPLIGCFDVGAIYSCKWQQEHWVEPEESEFFLVICLRYYFQDTVIVLANITQSCFCTGYILKVITASVQLQWVMLTCLFSCTIDIPNYKRIIPPMPLTTDHLQVRFLQHVCYCMFLPVLVQNT